jgi:hypothetical protein
MASRNGAGATANRKILDNIREATGASEEDVVAMLSICSGDANEATTRLLESARLMSRCAARPAPRGAPC